MYYLKYREVKFNRFKIIYRYKESIQKENCPWSVESENVGSSTP